MTSDTDRGAKPTADLILDAAIHSFSVRGYEATSMRQLAADVGVKTASLYNHYPAKEDLLWTIVLQATRELAELQRTSTDEEMTATERLREFVRNHVRFHALNAPKSRIISARLRSLSPDRYEEVYKFRKDYEQRLRGIILAGCTEGAFDVIDVETTTFAVLQMGTAIAQWFRPDGRLSIDQVGNQYIKYALRLVGARGAS